MRPLVRSSQLAENDGEQAVRYPDINEKGFTLIEVLVAVMLLAVGMMSAASMQTTAISGNKFSKDTSLRQAL